MRDAVRSPIAALTMAAAFMLAASSFSGPAFAQAKQQPAPAKQAAQPKQAPEPAPPLTQVELTEKQIEALLATQKEMDGKRSFLRTYAVERGDGMRCPP